MAEDALFASDYDGPCPLCEEDEQIGYCRYRNAEQEREREIKNDAEEVEDKESRVFKRDSEVNLEEITEENWAAGQEPEEKKIETEEDENKTEDTKQKSTEEKEEEQNKKADNVESDEQCKEDEQESMLGLKDDETKTDDEDDDDEEGNDLLVPPLEDDCILQMGPDCTIDLVMVCDPPVARCMNEDLSLCPPKSSDFSQQPPIKSPPRPLSITLPPQNPTLLPFQPQPLLQPQVPPQAQLEVPCLGKRPYGSSPAVDPQAMVSTRPLEVTLRQVYTTRRYTRFASRAALMPLASVGGESSTQALPSISADVPLMPPKKKTRTFYSSDQLEELERVFQDDHYPDGDKRKEIAAAIGVTPQRIMVWFQNRRAKWRKTAKVTTKKPPASRSQPCVQVNRPPIFTAPAIASQHPKPGNTLPPYSTIRTSRTTSPQGSACLDVAPCVSQGGFLEYMPPPMHSPPPIRRASLPLITAYNPSTHTVSLLLDTPEHSEPSSADTTPLSLQTDTGFDYDGMGTSVKLDFMTSASQNSTLNYQLNTFPQQSNTLLTQQTNSLLHQQPNTLLPQQTSCLMQQSSTLLPQYSHLSYLTPSPYLTPNPTESSSAPYLPLTTGTNNTLPSYTSSGHAYLQSQTGNQMLLQSGVHAFQAYPWTTDMYSQPGQYTQAVFRPQLSSQGHHESQYTQLLPQQHYVQLQGAPPQPSLPKPTPDPLLPNVKVESEDSQPIRVSEAEPTFHCDFSPINF